MKNNTALTNCMSIAIIGANFKIGPMCCLQEREILKPTPMVSSGDTLNNNKHICIFILCWLLAGPEELGSWTAGQQEKIYREIHKM